MFPSIDELQQSVFFVLGTSAFLGNEFPPEKADAAEEEAWKWRKGIWKQILVAWWDFIPVNHQGILIITSSLA